jgi:hypothetical protein
MKTYKLKIIVSHIIFDKNDYIIKIGFHYLLAKLHLYIYTTTRKLKKQGKRRLTFSFHSYHTIYSTKS